MRHVTIPTPQRQRATGSPTRAVVMAHTALLLASVGAVWATPAVDRANQATVLVRVVGDVTALQGLDERFNREKVELTQVELGTGSGILISPVGYVLTNLHVVESERKQLDYDGIPVELMLNVTRIDVELPSRGDGQDRPRRFLASVVATDPDLDLALLFVSGTDLPYLPLGDSDAVGLGRPVSAVGYPLGRAVDLATPGRDATPAPTITTGTLSAVRRDAQDSIRFLQTSATVNPGNSGGALLDEDGYVIGVVELKMKDAKDIGFAIPINLVKEFLARHGLDHALPTPPLARNVRFDLPSKGLRLMAPETFRDNAEPVTEVWSGQSVPGLTLRIGRLESGSTAAQLEHALLDGRLVKGLTATPTWSRTLSVTAPAEGRLGKASAPDGSRLLYLVASRGREAIVAFYMGAADHVAINESLLVDSLQSLEVNPLPRPQ